MISNLRIHCSGTIASKIVIPLQNLIPDPGERCRYLQGLPLANPVQATDKFEISLLVGADFYRHIIPDRDKDR